MSREIWVVEANDVEGTWKAYAAFMSYPEAKRELDRFTYQEYFRVQRYIPAEEGHDNGNS